MSSLRLETPSPVRHRRPTLTPLQPVQTYPTDGDAEFIDDDDIYRGDRPPSARPSTPASTQSSTSSSSSSSGSFLAGGRLGALTSVVEHAISRWARSARGRSSDTSSTSSSSSSASSSKSSKLTGPRPSLSRRRRRRSSVSSLPTVSSERDIVARITRMKALEESRQIPRQFILYRPPSVDTPRSSRRALRDSDEGSGAKRVTHTSSLSVVLGQLDASLKSATKARRRLGRAQIGLPRRSRSLISKPIRLQDADKASRPSSSGPHARRGGKGKAKEGPSNGRRHIRVAEPSGKAPKAWFLDVASPTWEDLRAIGKLLHLHPLTLEDILQQDPREKLDLFPKLGYYFVSFRAIETAEGRETSRWQLQKINEQLEPIPGHQEGVVSETNVYLVVFTEGICCFHFNDIAEHTDRIRNRISLLEEVANMTSDWIAHGILDSIVDSFFPYLDEIEKEVMAIEELILNPMKADGSTSSGTGIDVIRRSSSQTISEKEKTHPPLSASETISLSEKVHFDGSARPRFAVPRWTFRLLFRRLRRYVARRWRDHFSTSENPPSATTLTLRRMARARRLVTSLNRLLATKSEVITQIRKRLLKAGTSGLGNGSKVEELEVAIYMGDVQDHILTLQHSLNHYERILSESHPTYLSQLRTDVATSQSGTSKSIVSLTTISMAVPCMSVVIGMFSMNTTVPASDNDFSVFGIVLSLAIAILFIYLNVVRYWWKQTVRRRRALL
ncbi:hypothetical protein NP233_g4833 [Leucocoprinus birnbaumii]|uniref:Uncharacterized protein n=1 Tax=Leucocoprinus birnbaumii TaxID=56174 RepID=A0AAD5VTY9_9AGAR|nr:hypothetical protein NP233_g4833 [Leucocoprinus birnbaumii]